MNNNLLQIKIKQRLNKLASFDYDNLECWQIAEAFNKAQLEWVRRQLLGLNSRQAQSEQTTATISDLQMLMEERFIGGKKRELYFESTEVPDDYMKFTLVSARALTDCCPERIMSVYLAEEANADELLTDNFKGPSFEWGETFATIAENRIRIYTNGKFEIIKPKLVYYRKPRPVQFEGCMDIETGDTYKYNQICELKDEIAEIICDEAAAILAGDLDNITQYQRSVQAGTRNS